MERQGTRNARTRVVIIDDHTVLNELITNVMNSLKGLWRGPAGLRRSQARRSNRARSSRVKGPTFSELYCARERIAPAEGSERLFRAALYPHARPFVALIRLVRRRHFLADHEFIEDVGHLRSLEDLSLALGCYIEHPDNRGFLRRRLHLRVSARRMLRIVRSVFTPAVPETRLRGDTFEPFDGPGGTEPPAAD